MQPSVLADQRGFDAVTAVHPAIVHATVIANEVAVDVEVRPRAHAHDDFVPRIERDVAPLGAAGADRRRLVELPGASLVEEILGEQRAHGTEVDDVAGPGMVEPGFGVNADEGAVAALGYVEHRLFRHILHEADAARAQNAAVRHV